MIGATCYSIYDPDKHIIEIGESLEMWREGI